MSTELSKDQLAVAKILEKIAENEQYEVTDEESSLICRVLVSELRSEDEDVASAAHLLIKHVLPKASEAVRHEMIHEVALYEL